jgi:hypothetical protein
MYALVAAGLAAGGCGAGRPRRSEDAAPARGHAVVLESAAPRAVVRPDAAGRAVAASATRWLYARDRGAVTVAPATSRFVDELRAVTVPAGLRGGTARAIGVRAVAQTPANALVAWTIVDDRSRTQLAAQLALRAGHWIATSLEDD